MDQASFVKRVQNLVSKKQSSQTTEEFSFVFPNFYKSKLALEEISQ